VRSTFFLFILYRGVFSSVFGYVEIDLRDIGKELARVAEQDLDDAHVLSGF
jgi:hypothetical protein